MTQPRTAWAPMVIMLFGASMAWAQSPSLTMLEDPAEGAFAVSGSFKVTDPAALDFRLVFGGNGEAGSAHYEIGVTGGGVALLTVEGEKATPFGDTVEIPEAQVEQEVTFSLFRDDWRIAFVWCGRVVAKGYDQALTGPAVGYALAGGESADVWLQLVGEVDSGDTFEREEGAQDEWEQLAGKWELISLREDSQASQMRANLSTNPFSYYGTAEDRALAAMGSWFWRNCSYSVAFRARDQAPAAGLAFYVQDKDNYLLLRWQNRLVEQEGGPRLQLIAVLEGNHTVLAESPGGFFPHQWYALQVDICDDYLRAYVDGEPRLEADCDLLGHGQVGMYAEGQAGVWFDDVRVLGVDSFVESFAHDTPGKWRREGGKWQIGDGTAVPLDAHASLIVTGNPKWQEYRASTHIRAHSGGLGIAVGYRGPRDLVLFRWADSGCAIPYAGKAQLVRVTQDGETVLAEAPLPAEPPLELDASVVAEPTYVAGYLGELRLVNSMLDRPLSGAVGLYAQDPREAAFESLQLLPLPPRHAARVPKEFTDTKEHFEMADWASTRHPWVTPPEEADPQVWWTKGDYYGALEVQFRLSKIGEAEGTMTVHLGAEQDRPDVGPVLAVTAQKGSRALGIALSCEGVDLGTAEVETEGEACAVAVERRGERLVILVDGKTALTAMWQGPTPREAPAPQEAPAG